MSRYQRGYELIAAMQSDAGNELLGDLDSLTVDSWTNDEDKWRGQECSYHPRVMIG